MAKFAKGDGRPRRTKGVPNKVTGALKDMILQALSNAGGVEYLMEQAKSQPSAFMALVGRVLPLQVKEGGPDPQVPVNITHNYQKKGE